MRLGARARSVGLERLLHVEQEGPLLPVDLDELEGVLGDLLAVGDHEGAALLALEVGDRRQGQLAVQLVAAGRHSVLELGVVVAKDAAHAGQLLGRGGVHARECSRADRAR